jgi:zinc and cadmium transporter
MTIWIYAILSVLLVSIVSLMGVFTISLTGERLKKVTLFLVSFAVGALFGDALIHLIPESFGKLGPTLPTSLFIVVGILVFFVVEKFLRWRHCHVENCEGHTSPVVTMNLIGDGVHNMIDGMLIAASYSVSFLIGATTTLAVLSHEIPQEIGDFGVLVHGGLPIRKAVLYNFFSALCSVVGAVISLVIGPHVAGYAESLLPITAGGFMYMAGSDLIPELHHEVRPTTSLIQFVLIVAGVAVMVLV